MGRRDTIEAFLLECKVLIDNSINDTEVQTMLAEYGYTADRLAAGKNLLEKADDMYLKQKKEYSEQYNASSMLDNKFEQMQKTYMKHFKVAKVACMDDVEKRNKLGLTGARKQTIAGLLGQAKLFYGNASENMSIRASLQEYGITLDKLNAGSSLVDEVIELKVTKEKETGEAQQATVDRDAAFDELNEWVSKLRKIARIALEEKPQYLEKLGIKA